MRNTFSGGNAAPARMSGARLRYRCLPLLGAVALLFGASACSGGGNGGDSSAASSSGHTQPITGSSSSGGSGSSGTSSSGAGSSGTSSSGGSSSSGAAPAYKWTQLDNTLDSFVATLHPVGSDTVAGYSFILYDDSGVLHTRGGGNQNADSVMALASSTKMPSAAAILTLVDNGQLALDAPVAGYLLAGGVRWPADKLGITMRMLLAHTSGLPGLNDPSSPACLTVNSGITLKKCVQTVADTPLVSAPGAEFNYGGADYQVAGYIATVLSQRNWQDFFDAAIATPLGLTTFSYGNAPLVSNPRIAGGASSNTADYASILRMIQHFGQFNGKQVLSPEMVAELEHDQIHGLPVAYTPFPAGMADDYPGYGFGMWTESAALYPGSNGPEYSDPGLSGTMPWIDSSLGYGAVILINQDVPTGLDMWNAVRPLIIGQLTHPGS